MRRQHLESILLLSVAAAACSAGAKESGGPATSRAFEVGDFRAIEVAGPFDVRVTTGKTASVRAEGPQKLIDRMSVLVEGNRLRIRPEQKGLMNSFSWNDRNATVTVTVPTLEAARIAGSGDVRIDRVSGERFEADVAGSGDLDVGQVAVRQLKLSIAGSGNGRVAGKAEDARYSIAGSGEVDAAGLTATRAEASIAGSGSIRANATGQARASIMGSGDIEISGGARCETSKKGSGDIRCS